MKKTIKIKNLSKHPLPKYQTVLSAGMDLHANIDQSIAIQPGQREIVSTGLFLELPEGFEAQIRPRSGLAFKHGVTVLNSPGTIDADYRGEIKVLLMNHGHEAFEINDGERIAQMVITEFTSIQWEETNQLNDTERGEGGYGSSGK